MQCRNQVENGVKQAPRKNNMPGKCWESENKLRSTAKRWNTTNTKKKNASKKRGEKYCVQEKIVTWWLIIYHWPGNPYPLLYGASWNWSHQSFIDGNYFVPFDIAELSKKLHLRRKEMPKWPNLAWFERTPYCHHGRRCAGHRANVIQNVRQSSGFVASARAHKKLQHWRKTEAKRKSRWNVSEMDVA